MNRLRRVGCVIALLVGLAGFPTPSQSQSALFQLTLQRSHISESGYERLDGFAAAFVRPGIGGPFGFRADYASTTTPGPDIAQNCGFDSCSPGPFSQSHTLRSVGAGVTAQLGQVWVARISLAANVSVYIQDTRLKHQLTGRESSDGGVTDYGLGPSATLRFPAVLFGLGPVLSARYDRVFAGTCPADASCYSDRNVGSVGLGLAWSR